MILALLWLSASSSADIPSPPPAEAPLAPAEPTAAPAEPPVAPAPFKLKVAPEPEAPKAGSGGGDSPVDPPPADVVQGISPGVSVDWTTLELRVHTSTRGTAVQSVQAVEQLARREVDAAITQSAPRVPVSPSELFAQLLDHPDLGPAVRSRLARWEVSRATYGTSGRVELEAALSLQELLKPWSLAHARPGAAPPVDPAAPTGLVVDARGTGLAPAYAPRLLGPDGRVLYSGELFEEEAVTLVPYLFVPDPAHPAAARAGSAPALVRAVEASGSDLTLDPSGATRLVELSEVLLGRVPVVIVVDGP